MFLSTAIKVIIATITTIAFTASVSASPIEARQVTASDNCKAMQDRTFRLFATQDYDQQQGSAVQAFQAEIAHNFEPNNAAPEVSSCISANTVSGPSGKGCKWCKTKKPQTSPVGTYTVDHGSFSPTVANDADVKLSGDGCDDQILKCTADVGVVEVSFEDRLSVVHTDGDVFFCQGIQPNSQRWVMVNRCAVVKPNHLDGVSQFTEIVQALQVSRAVSFLATYVLIWALVGGR